MSFKKKEIPSDWEIIKISEMSENPHTIVQTGPFGSVLHSYDYSEDGVPLLLVKNIVDGKYVPECPNVNFKKANELKKFWLEEGDIVFTRVGAVGRTLYIDNRYKGWMFSGQTLRLRIRNEEINNEYINYYFRSDHFSRFIEAIALGTTRPSLNTSIIENLEIPLPPKKEQDHIVAVLNNFDEKIDLNNKLCSISKELGGAIFKHWFFDFEFPDEHGMPYKSSGGTFKQIENSKIPEQWSFEIFSSLISLNPKRVIKKGAIAKKVGMSDLEPYQSWVNSYSTTKYTSGSKFKNEDILFARITPSLENGKTAYVNFLDDDEVAFGSTEFIVFSKKEITSSLYIFHLVTSEDIRNIAINSMTGSSGRQRVPNELFDHISIINPDKEIIYKFDAVINPIYSAIKKNAREITLLQEIRDTLLLNLMSGLLRVPMEE